MGWLMRDEHMGVTSTSLRCCVRHLHTMTVDLLLMLCQHDWQVLVYRALLAD